MSNSRKRKSRPGKAAFVPDDVDTAPDPTLFIQAYEADIIRGPQAKQAADSLDVTQHLLNRSGRSGLIQWNPSNSHTAPAFPSDADDNFTSSSPDKTPNNSIWVDRYDARLLLDSLPKLKSTPSASPPSPTGWSDIPSDSEDTFFFSPSEADDYRQEKRRKLMDQAREERLKARRAEDGVELEEEEVWGGSDEEPDEAQTVLMERTAASIMSTGNPAQLEMRILANYGGDKRFAFLRGRWKAAWVSMKRKAQQDQEAKKAAAATTTESGLGNLADYGDSDEEDEEAEGAAPDPEPTLESDALAARQARAKAWAESRRASKSNASS
ncbi:hypothetical protein MVEN_02515400 [Mycena venus]|uniref:Uncharacterized protein n=1 Tax=Mycena venus TaxID=2733690 RepID=A0A8H7CA80_9AGAR|nr:hypothetical protein MVEN_02515400 [Mycena venus]